MMAFAGTYVSDLDKAICTRQSSRLFLRPYSPTSFSSPSRRSFSKGRLGFLNVFPFAIQQESQNMAAVLCHTVALDAGKCGFSIVPSVCLQLTLFVYIASMHCAQSMHHGCIRRVGAADSQLR